MQYNVGKNSTWLRRVKPLSLATVDVPMVVRARVIRGLDTKPLAVVCDVVMAVLLVLTVVRLVRPTVDAPILLPPDAASVADGGAFVDLTVQAKVLFTAAVAEGVLAPLAVMPPAVLLVAALAVTSGPLFSADFSRLLLLSPPLVTSSCPVDNATRRPDLSTPDLRSATARRDF